MKCRMKISYKFCACGGTVFLMQSTHCRVSSFVLYVQWQCIWLYACVYCLGPFVKLRTATISFVMFVLLSAYPHGTARLPLCGFSLNYFKTFQ
jgi:hypothetical protein